VCKSIALKPQTAHCMRSGIDITALSRLECEIVSKCVSSTVQTKVTATSSDFTLFDRTIHDRGYSFDICIHIYIYIYI
jgi:hypothetical protein